MGFTITSAQDVTIDGIGLLEGGEPHIVSAEELRLFQVLHGISLGKAKFPSSITVEYHLEEEVK